MIFSSLTVFLISIVYVTCFKTAESTRLRKHIVRSKEERKNLKIDRFIAFVASRKSSMITSRADLSEALLKLKSAVNAIAAAVGYEFRYADLVLIERDIAKVSNEKLFSTRSYYLRHAALVLARSLLTLQRQKYPDLAEQALELRSAAEAFQGTDLKLDQDQKIHLFLQSARQLVKKMKEPV